MKTYRSSSEERPSKEKLEMTVLAKMGNIMGSIENVQDYIPIIKRLPDKVGTVELGLDDLKERVIKNYVTHLQVEDTIRVHLGDIERRCREENYKIIEDLKKDINKRIPSQEMISMMYRT